MKIVKIYTVYPFYLESLNLSQDSDTSYYQLYQTIREDWFSWPGSWAQSLRKRGLEVEEFLANCLPLQKAWLQELGPKTLGQWPLSGDWRLEITRLQVLQSRPDILVVDDYHLFHRDWLNSLRKDCPQIKAIVGWCGANYSNPEVFKSYDLVASCIPELVRDFQRRGHQSTLIPHAYEPEVDRHLKQKSCSEKEFTFVGQVYRGVHREREKILLALAKHTPLRIYSPSYYLTNSLADHLKLTLKWPLYAALHQANLKKYISPRFARGIPPLARALEWKWPPSLPVHPQLKKLTCPPVFGLKMLQKLRDSYLTLNTHIDISAQSASNMRLFEATGVGTCLLTDWKSDLPQYFEPDRDLLTYRSPMEAVEKLNWIVENPQKRDEIAANGRKRVLEQHTFEHRAPLWEDLFRRLTHNFKGNRI